MALRWPWGGSVLPSIWLADGFEVALGWLEATLSGFSGSEVRGWKLRFISLPNTTSLPRLPGGGLGAPWTCAGTIAPLNHPLFDQPGLSKSLSGGVSTVKGSSKSDVQPPGAAFCAKCCGTVDCAFRTKKPHGNAATPDGNGSTTTEATSAECARPLPLWLASE